MPMQIQTPPLPEGFFEGLPQPMYWRVLVRPLRFEATTDSGLALPAEAVKASQYLNYIGQIVALGPLAFKSERYAGQDAFPQVGDWCAFGQYAGQKITHRDVSLVLINDDELLARVPDPATLKVYV